MLNFFYIWALGLLSVFIFVEDSVQCLVCVVLTFFAVEPTCSRFIFLFFSTSASIANFGIRVFDIIALMVLILILVVLSLFFSQILKPMGASSDAKEEIGMSSKGEAYSNGVEMDTDDDEFLESTSIHELGEKFLKIFCKKAAVSFFNEYGLISHQINSYNDFIKNGIQRAFDSFGEIIVEPGFDPSKKGEGEWRYASVRFGKVTLDPPIFWGGEGNVKEFNMLPRHARLQNMTYSARMKVNIDVQVNKSNFLIELVQFFPFHFDRWLTFLLML